MDRREIAHQFNNVLMGIGPHVEVIKRAAKDNQRILDSVAHIEAALKKGRELTAAIKTEAGG
jgi:hypothetical protein